MLDIKILGIPESKEVFALTKRIQTAFDHLNLEYSIQVESDLQKLIAYNPSGIPAMVIGDDVVFQKEIPEVEDIIKVINEYKVKMK